ncbi:MAG TPA: calcium-translocating P-type ATPase, PMCA-type [Flavobacteriales bacterium]|nr:calcium-translocating P-type ATPase, PMCA-type [Flavobacteriales bacterium]|tara:strand:+ start:65234 stop:67795 length:2562 start_codon:yes stop_codon:yes gene_type:complete
MKKEAYKGLSEIEAKSLLSKYGPNAIIRKHKNSALKILLNQFTSPLIIILLGASIVSFLVNYLQHISDFQEYIDTILILVIVFLSALAGFAQDYKAAKAVEALQKMAVPRAVVIRDHIQKVIDSTLIVPGDIVVLNSGDIIPADGKILEATHLQVNESSLTGESEAVGKTAGDEVYMNTFVNNGKALMQVEKTGMRTKMGKIAAGLQQDETPDFFKQEIAEVSRKLMYISLVIIVITFVVGYFKYDLFTSLMLAITLAVAAIPEGLPAVVTLTLAIASKKMMKQNALLRKLSVAEVLGSVNVICTDKTGTLTQNKMSVTRFYCNNIDTSMKEVSGKLDKTTEMLFKIGAVCNDTKIGTDENGNQKILGEQSEIALRKSAEQFGIIKEDLLDTSIDIIDEIPFSSERKRMSVIVKENNTQYVYTKGAPEVILDLCSFVEVNGEISPLDDALKIQILEQNKKYASNALRVMGFAYKELKNKDEKPEENLVFVGLQAMIDPPREEVKPAIEKAHRAGIQTIMITGDNPVTAQAIANEISLHSTGVITGPELDKLNDKLLFNKIESGIRIFARTTPFHKERILSLMQDHGNIVAMTGDGVNDALAIHKANVGIAMGIRGTEVTKQAADMILLDDNYATIINAIREGRTVFINIRKFIDYLLTCNIAEVLLVLLLTFFVNLSEPVLLPIHLLWLNLLTDGLVALALGTDPPLKDIMNLPPRKIDNPLINNKLVYKIFLLGSLMSIVLFGTLLLTLQFGLHQVRAILVTMVILYEFVRITVIKYEYKESIFSNKYLVQALLVSFVMQLIVIYAKPISDIFSFETLTLYSWFYIIGGTLIGLIFSLLISKQIVKKYPEIY